MPRTARIKSENAVFHIMIRSISEVDLFKGDRDKSVYLKLMKKYQNLYCFKVYAYCLMNNHAHFIIYANGADISKIMHSVNLSYARYFNKSYGRHGHLFQDRFKSKVITSDRYLRVLSTYIHNNPKDLEGFEDRPEQYQFSSLPVFLNEKKDHTGLLDIEFINAFFKLDMIKSNISSHLTKEYMDYVHNFSESQLHKDMEFIDECSEYVNSRKPLIRNFSEAVAVNYIVEKTGILKWMLYAKNSREARNSRAMLVLLLRSFCDFKCADICRLLGNITQARVSGLTRTGLELVKSKLFYRNLVEEFLISHSTISL
ncbi:MAG: transposase [Clostridiaceae bacterium]